MAAYEVLNVFVSNTANDSLPVVAKLSEVVLQRLEGTIPMQQQIVSADDKNTLEEIQTSLATVLLVKSLGLFQKFLSNSTTSPSSNASSLRSNPNQTISCRPSYRFSIL